MTPGMRLLVLIAAPVLGVLAAVLLVARPSPTSALSAAVLLLALIGGWRLARRGASRHPKEKQRAAAGLLPYWVDMSGVLLGAVLYIAVLSVPIYFGGGTRQSSAAAPEGRAFALSAQDLRAMPAGRPVGGTFRTPGGLQATLIGFRTSMGRANNRPDHGNLWLVSFWLFRNTGHRPARIAPSDFGVISRGVLRRPNFFYFTLVDNNLLDLDGATLNPGSSQVRDVLFQVNVHEMRPRVVFRSEAPSAGGFGVWTIHR
jgi:hypothetical protein